MPCGKRWQMRMSPLGDRVKLVALTGYGQAEDRKMAQNAVFDRHLVEPVGWDRLQEVLHEALQRDAG
jgi:two-component system, sensor histidine kinase